MIDKLNKAILILYNLCGIALLALYGAGMAPPVGHAPLYIWILVSIPFVALIIAHIWLFILKKKVRKKK